MGQPEHLEPAASTTPEHAIYELNRCVALALGALAGFVLLARGPGAEHAPGAASSATSGAAARAEPSRAELERAITQLTAWLDQTARAPRTALEANQRLLAQGRSALERDPSPIALSLERLVPSAPPEPLAAPAALGEPGPGGPAQPWGAERDEPRDASARATLAILLEAGTPLERELPLRSGPVALGRLLELALPEVNARQSADPWTLDLLAFAVLAGKSEQREALARQLHTSLLALEREQRGGAARAADGGHDGARAAGGAFQLGASAFRAIAVLGEPALEQQGLRYLNGLLRHDARQPWRARLASAGSERERLAIHAQALEALGLLEQALFGAHLAFRREAHAAPAPHTARAMRRAAGDLLEHLSALERGGAFDDPSAVAPPGLERAAVQALRGLRAARVGS